MAHRCTGSFAYGNPPRVHSAGSLVGDDDPILRTHGAFFEPAEAQVARQEAVPRSVAAVETATAAPGEVRETSVARRGRAGRGDT
jgi:hypothetical protein